MGVDIYVNSFDSHDMLYANRSMVEPYGGIEHFWGKNAGRPSTRTRRGSVSSAQRGI
jgi:hypothetical protein